MKVLTLVVEVEEEDYEAVMNGDIHKMCTIMFTADGEDWKHGGLEVEASICNALGDYDDESEHIMTPIEDRV